MIIGIDIRLLGNSGQSGIKEYTEKLLEALIPLASEHTIKLFYTSRKNPLPNYQWLKASHVQLYDFKFPNELLFLSNRLFGLPKIDWMLGGVDIFFSPHFFLAPLSKKVKRVTTFHDLSYLRFPEFFSLRQNIWHQIQMRPKRQARLSNKIIAVSHSTKHDLEQLYSIDPSNIFVVYPGTHIAKPEDSEVETFKKERDLDKYIFTLSTLEPRKNIPSIIRAFELLKKNLGFDGYELLIAGAKGWKYESILNMIEASPCAKQIRYLGSISEPDKPLYYAGAEVFVSPSFFEGFGFPVLEAIACGVPVITSNNSSLPEVVGNAAVLVSPYIIPEITQAMETILTDSNLRKILIERGHEQSSQYSWQKTTQEVLRLLESTAL